MRTIEEFRDGELSAEELWLEGAATELMDLLPVDITQKVSEVVRKARKNSPFSPNITDLLLVNRFEEVLYTVLYEGELVAEMD